MQEISKATFVSFHSTPCSGFRDTALHWQAFTAHHAVGSETQPCTGTLSHHTMQWVQRHSPALACFHSTPCSGFRDTALHWQTFTSHHAVGSETQPCTGTLSHHTMQCVQRHSPALACIYQHFKGLRLSKK